MASSSNVPAVASRGVLEFFDETEGILPAELRRVGYPERWRLGREVEFDELKPQLEAALRTDEGHLSLQQQRMKKAISIMNRRGNGPQAVLNLIHQRLQKSAVTYDWARDGSRLILHQTIVRASIGSTTVVEGGSDHPASIRDRVAEKLLLLCYSDRSRQDAFPQNLREALHEVDTAPIEGPGLFRDPRESAPDRPASFKRMSFGGAASTASAADVPESRVAADVLEPLALFGHGRSASAMCYGSGVPPADPPSRPSGGGREKSMTVAARGPEPVGSVPDLPSHFRVTVDRFEENRAGLNDLVNELQQRNAELEAECCLCYETFSALRPKETLDNCVHGFCSICIALIKDKAREQRVGGASVEFVCPLCRAVFFDVVWPLNN